MAVDIPPGAQMLQESPALRGRRRAPELLGARRADRPLPASRSAALPSSPRGPGRERGAAAAPEAGRAPARHGRAAPGRASKWRRYCLEIPPESSVSAASTAVRPVPIREHDIVARQAGGDVAGPGSARSAPQRHGIEAARRFGSIADRQDDRVCLEAFAAVETHSLDGPVPLHIDDVALPEVQFFAGFLRGQPRSSSR